MKHGHVCHPQLVCSAAPQLLDAAEAKAYWGLAKNYGALEALTAALIEQETLSGAELADVIEKVLSRLLLGCMCPPAHAARPLG